MRRLRGAGGARLFRSVVPGLALACQPALAACGAPTEGRWIEGFGEAAVAARCEPVPGLPAGPVLDATPAGDTAFLVLDAGGTAHLHDAELARRWSLTPAPRPGSMPGRLVSAALAADTLLLADVAVPGVRRLLVRGGEAPPLALPFVVARVRAGASLLVAPLPAPGVDRLLYRVLRGRPLPLPVPAVGHHDPAVRVLLNRTALAVDRGGWVLAHSLVRPRVYLGGDGPGAARFALPLPALARRLEGRVPVPPVGLASPVLIAAVDVAIDGAAGELLFLTTSGRTRAGGPEMAIVRTDRELNPLRISVLDVPARTLLYEARTRRALVVGEEGPWNACTL